MVNRDANQGERDYTRYLTPTPFIKDDGELVRIAYAPLTGDSGWSVPNFVNGYMGAKELAEADVPTFSRIMTGDENSLGGFTAEQVEESRQSCLNFVQRGMTDYGVKYSGALSNIAWNEGMGRGLFDLALTMPTFRKNGGNKWNPVLDVIDASRSEQKLASENPQEFMDGKMNNLDAFARAFYGPFVNDILVQYKDHFKNRMIGAIGEFGFPKFVSENIKVADGYATEQVEQLIELNGEIQAGIVSLGQNPSEEAKRQFQERMSAKKKYIGDSCYNAMDYIVPMVSRLEDVTIETVQRQMEEAEAERNSQGQQPRQ
jgi:hypothetical protein